jgi:hypothetical protein
VVSGVSRTLGGREATSLSGLWTMLVLRVWPDACLASVGFLAFSASLVVAALLFRATESSELVVETEPL